MNYIQQTLQTLGRSFGKLKTGWLYVSIIDAVFFGVLFLTGSLFLKLLQGAVLSYSDIPVGLASENPETAAAVLAQLKPLFTSLVIETLLFFVVVVLIYTLFKGTIWTYLEGKKMTWALFKKFSLVNLYWILSWTILAVLLVLAMESRALGITALVLIALFIHLTGLLHDHYVVNRKLKEALAYTFETGLGKFYKFIIPYFAAFVVFLVWAQVWRLFAEPTDIGVASLLLFVVIFAPFLSWFRIYMKDLYKTL